jgi:rSAM/selenodomain-associated transferase 1
MEGREADRACNSADLRTGIRPTRVIVFAKAPRPGLVKTRLIPALGAAGAARLAQRMLHDTLAAALDARVGPVELCATPDPDDPAWHDTPLPPQVESSAQGDGDLGARMARAAGRALRRGDAVLLVGTDCAEMSSALLRHAAAVLRDVDVVIHPSADGGYVLLGLARFSVQLFTDIAWSTDTVATVTIERIRALGWSLAVGDTLHDIDVADDLRLAAKSVEGRS